MGPRNFSVEVAVNGDLYILGMNRLTVAIVPANLPDAEEVARYIVLGLDVMESARHLARKEK